MTPEQAHTGDDTDTGRVRLHPLTFEEALRALVAVKPPRSDDSDEGGDDDHTNGSL